MHNHMRRISTYKISYPYSSLDEDRRDANERGESNLTHAVRYAFSSTTPNAQDCNSIGTTSSNQDRFVELGEEFQLDCNCV